MTEETITNNAPAQEQKANDKEYNFRMLEAKYEKALAQERAAREQAEKLAQEALHTRKHVEEDDSSDDPYVDEKRLNKKLERFREQNQRQTQGEIQNAVQKALVEERKQNWLKQNPDFYEVLQHAEKIYQTDPELAETILEMPEGFERQKLVYKSIKALGFHKPQQKQAPIQEKIDANRKNAYYIPSQMGTAPYAMAGDFSPSGQKNAYEKMQELKSKLRI